MLTVKEIRDFIKDLPDDTPVTVKIVDGVTFLMDDAIGFTIYASMDTQTLPQNIQAD